MSTSCSYETGTPASGECAGPLERALMRREALVPCPANSVSYIRDNNPSGGVLCGECEPGSAGWEDSRRLCGANEYCSDDAHCVDMAEHPLLDAPCPYEVGGQTRSGWCGSGLRCVLHKCVICTDGEHRDNLNLVCYKGRWVYDNPWNTSLHPELVIAPAVLGVCVVIFIAVLIGVLVERRKRRVKVQKEYEEEEEEVEEEKEDNTTPAAKEDDIVDTPAQPSSPVAQTAV